MAAPPPANPLVGLLQAAAAVDGLEFDVVLANASPQARGRPGPGPTGLPTPLPSISHQAAPAAVPAFALLPDCSDRQYHTLAPGAGPCTSAANPVAGFAAGAMGGLPVPPLVPSFPIDPGVVDTTVCQLIGMVRNFFHGPGHSICLWCLENVRRQPWSRHIHDEVTNIPALTPGPPPPLTGAAAGRDFMTRLCEGCERLELTMLRTRWYNPNTWPAGIVVRTRRRNEQYPFLTCTCLEKWHENCTAVSDVCVQHRHRESCAKHDELLIIRAQNDQWLRETTFDHNRLRQLDPAIPADAAIITARDAVGTHRACRCGKNPTAAAVPRVYMCLGCEGVLHTTPRPAPGAALILPGNAPTTATRSTTRLTNAGGEYRLRRERR